MDNIKLLEELTLMHIMFLYDFMSPIDYLSDLTAKNISERKEAALTRYNNDIIFHARVDRIVAYTINIINTNEILSAVIHLNENAYEICDEQIEDTLIVLDKLEHLTIKKDDNYE